jgi:CubicO group peptidase (beta-lactamase class C family)
MNCRIPRVLLRRGFLVTAALGLIPAQVAGQIATLPSLSAAQVAAVDAAVRTEMDKQKAVGLAIGIVRDGVVVYTKGYGLADREKGVPVSNSTMFRWASCSKPLTAVAAMQLVQAGQLALDADVRSLVPEFPDHGAVITVRHLLCHQGGIVHYSNGKVIRTKRDYSTSHPFRDVVVALDTFKESPLVNPPGTKYSYTTHGYILLSAAVERAGRQPFAEQVRDRIVKPLGMTTLRPDYQWEDIPTRTIGYARKAGEVVRSDDSEVCWMVGGGGFISNIDDFARFAAGLVNGGLVNKASAATMWQPQRLTSGEQTDYGLGFSVDVAEDGRLQVSHSGSQEKTRTRFVIYPRERHGVVVMTNSEWVNPRRFTTLVYSALAADTVTASP